MLQSLEAFQAFQPNKESVEYLCMPQTLLNTAYRIINDLQPPVFFGSYFVKFLKLILTLVSHNPVRNSNSVGEMIPAFLGSLSHSACGDLSDAWPLIQKPGCCDGISFCDSYPELTGEDENSFSLETEKNIIVDSSNDQDLNLFMSTESHFRSLAESVEHLPKTSCISASLNQTLAPEPLSATEQDGTANNTRN